MKCTVPRSLLDFCVGPQDKTLQNFEGICYGRLRFEYVLY